MAVIEEAKLAAYHPRAPYCPPVVTYTCVAAASSECDSVRAALYPAAGLNPADGSVADCALAGRVRVRHVSPDASGAIVFGASFNGSATGNLLTFASGNPSDIDAAQLAAFVRTVADQYGDPSYSPLPSTPCGGLRLGGAAVPLAAATLAGGSIPQEVPPWEYDTWPYPGNEEPCPDGDYFPQLYCSGTRTTPVPRYRSAAPPLLEVGFQSDRAHVPWYRVAAAAEEDGGSAAANDTRVTLSVLAAVEVTVGMVPSLGACHGWAIDRSRLRPTYARIWTGALSDVDQAVGAGGLTRSVALTLRDSAAPGPIALPRYDGIAWIAGAYVSGGIWFISTLATVLLTLLAFYNSQVNQNLPPPFYRYMRQWRGW